MKRREVEHNAAQRVRTDDRQSLLRKLAAAQRENLILADANRKLFRERYALCELVRESLDRSEARKLRAARRRGDQTKGDDRICYFYRLHLIHDQ